MLRITLNEESGIVILTPEGRLSTDDFKSVAKTIDPYIEKSGKLNGIVIHVKSFPSWDSFSSLVTHIEFVKEHHKDVSHVAFSTDSPLASLAEHVAKHFVNADIKSFSYDKFEDAKKWIIGG